jgi:short-subunit dehydrogenase
LAPEKGAFEKSGLENGVSSARVRELDGKVVVITGAGGGIGAALAEAFARRRCKVALLDIDLDAATRVAERLRAGGATTSAHQVDVRDRGTLERVRDEVVAAHGTVDILINNAGLTVFSSFEQLRDDEIERQLAVNLRGVIDGCRVFLPVLRTRPRAHIVNTSSIAGLAGMPWQTLYCTTKFAIRGFTAALRSELVGEGIGVTCLIPGTTATNIVGAAGTRDPAITEALSQQLVNHGYPPRWLARKLVRGVRRNAAEVVVGPDGFLLMLGLRLSPALVRASMRMLVALARRRGLSAAPRAAPELPP